MTNNKVTLLINVITFDFDKRVRGKEPYKLFCFAFKEHRAYFLTIGTLFLPRMNNCTITLIRNDKVIDTCTLNWTGGHGDHPAFQIKDKTGIFAMSQGIRDADYEIKSGDYGDHQFFQKGDTLSLAVDYPDCTQEDYEKELFLLLASRPSR